MAVPSTDLAERHGINCFRAVVSVTESWNAQGLCKLAAQSVDTAVLDDVPDHCRAVMKAKRKVAQQLPANILYDEQSGCICHTLHNLTAKCTGENTLVGNCHAVHYVESVTSHRNQLLHAAKALLTKELVIIPKQPRDRYAKYTQVCMNNTLLRTEHVVRGRLNDLRPPGKPSPRLQETRNPDPPQIHAKR